VLHLDPNDPYTHTTSVTPVPLLDYLRINQNKGFTHLAIKAGFFSTTPYYPSHPPLRRRKELKPKERNDRLS
jgi:hypothetical protein